MNGHTDSSDLQHGLDQPTALRTCRGTVSWLLLALWVANVTFFCVYFIKLGWTNLR